MLSVTVMLQNVYLRNIFIQQAAAQEHLRSTSGAFSRLGVK